MTIEGVAIVGMSGRFPGAGTVAQLWENLLAGKESISRFTWEELEARDPAALARDPAYVRARGVLEHVESFDAGFFGFTPREVEVMDPQHRIFLEICWEALEDAGWDPARFPGAIGVYAGQALPTYLFANLAANRAFLDKVTGEYQVGSYPVVLGNDKDYLATRVCYKLDLKGPGMTVQCACSTSLVAVAQAVASLQAYQTDMALAGGVSITFPQKRGYLFQEGGMVSPDGRCRAFDAQADGTIFSSGAGVVLLKRLEDALADRDHVYAVIKAAALNNDGALKVGYMAPSPERQAEVIATAHALADIDPGTIGYIETHGTGTPLGDPIELDGLTRAFRARTDKKGYCALGSLKTNLGHLEVAAGVSGLIKAALVVREGVMPASLHYTAPNPKIDFAASPFFVNTERRAWTGIDGNPRRAGVSAFGVGGTNAHLLLEEQPPQEAGKAWPAQLLVLSARSDAALAESSVRLAAWLRAHPSADLADVAFTLQEGRRAFPHRRAVVARTAAEAAALLEKALLPTQAAASTPVVFLLPGQGAQYPAMGAALYQHSQVFRTEADRCLALLAAKGLDLRGLLFVPEGPAPRAPEAAERLQQTAVTQPAVFVVEWALSKLWESLGVKPAALVGHSVGEFCAAALAGSLELEEALSLVAARGRLVQALPPGAMLSVRVSAEDVRPYLTGRLSLAAENGPQLSVVAGPTPEVEALERALSAKGTVFRRLRTSHAFHSSMMEPAMPAIAQEVARLHPRPARLPIASTLEGRLADPAVFADPGYWVRHLREPVRFLPAVKAAAALPGALLLEVGPGRALSTLAKQAGAAQVAASLTDAGEESGELEALLEAAGRLWCAGAPVQFAGLHPGPRRRVSLPTVVFERKRHFIDAPPLGAAEASAAPAAAANGHAPAPQGADAGALASLIEAQLVLMQRQLALLRESPPEEP
jgi:acyl transferase domain-containing protein